VTAKLRNDIARRFRERPENAIRADRIEELNSSCWSVSYPKARAAALRSSR
jgi:hypothetical protein